MEKLFVEDHEDLAKADTILPRKAADLWLDVSELDDMLDLLYHLYDAWFVTAGEPTTLPKPDVLLAAFTKVQWEVTKRHVSDAVRDAIYSGSSPSRGW